MKFVLHFTDEAKAQLKHLKQTAYLQAPFKAVAKVLVLLQENPRHPGLQTHKYHSLYGPLGEEVFEAYAQQHTPGAWRVFFYYGPAKGGITVFAIVTHP
ncbi:MAG: hypothetical protein HY209_05475 [Candidatus Omnitrophica bacterium]|nr:hypothetical protein [Candidatus Omnitrophota bacterium]